MNKSLLALFKHSGLFFNNRNRCYSNAIACVQSRSFSTTKKMFKSSVFSLQDATKEQVQEFLNSFDTVLTDCDGSYIMFVPIS